MESSRACRNLWTCWSSVGNKIYSIPFSSTRSIANADFSVGTMSIRLECTVLLHVFKYTNAFVSFSLGDKRKVERDRAEGTFSTSRSRRVIIVGLVSSTRAPLFFKRWRFNQCHYSPHRRGTRRHSVGASQRQRRTQEWPYDKRGTGRAFGSSGRAVIGSSPPCLFMWIDTKKRPSHQNQFPNTDIHEKLLRSLGRRCERRQCFEKIHDSRFDKTVGWKPIIYDSDLRWSMAVRSASQTHFLIKSSLELFRIAFTGNSKWEWELFHSCVSFLSIIV